MKKQKKSLSRLEGDLQVFESQGNTKMVKIIKACIKRIKNSDPNIDGYTKMKERIK